MKKFNILTGLKLDITYLSLVFLSASTTDAIIRKAIMLLALLGKVEVLILLLMAIDSDSATMSDVNLTSLVGILSILGAFLEFTNLRMVLISLGVTLEPQLEEGIEMELDCKFLFLCISTILGRFLYLSKRELKTPFLLSDTI